MLLSARMLENVSGVNAFARVNEVSFTEGDTPTVYFQLVDLSLDRAEEGFAPAGRRYVPAAGALLQVVLDNIDSARRITRYANQPFAQDPSIWAVPILPADQIVGTVNMRLTLTEGQRTTKGLVQAALAVHGLSGMTRY